MSELESVPTGSGSVKYRRKEKKKKRKYKDDDEDEDDHDDTVSTCPKTTMMTAKLTQSSDPPKGSSRKLTGRVTHTVKGQVKRLSKLYICKYVDQCTYV